MSERATIEDPSADELLTTGDMARLTDSTLRTVRFYEEEGLITPVERVEGGHRQFRRAQSRRLELALHLREAGLSISEVKELFGLKHEAGSPDKATRGMTTAIEEQLGKLRDKVDKLQRLERELAGMLETISGCGDCSPVEFPARCERCDVLKSPDRSRTIDVLWR